MKIRVGFVSNSSSSSFICETDMSIPEVEKKLHSIFKFGKELGVISERLKYSDIFADPFIADKKYAKDLTFYNSDLIEIKGKLIIESAEDNSIPYELWELIESIFEGRRVHLG